MFRKRIVCLAAVLSLLCCAVPAWAAEVDSDTVYCFTSEDFSGEEPLVGICITEIPNAETGAVLLGQRVLQPGDILTAEQLAQMTFAPVRTETDGDAVLTYLPIYENRVEQTAVLTIGIRGKERGTPALPGIHTGCAHRSTAHGNHIRAHGGEFVGHLLFGPLTNLHDGHHGGNTDDDTQHRERSAHGVAHQSFQTGY